MTQEDDVDAVIRQRIRSLRLARGWSLENLAARCQLSASTLSRIESGHRRMALDQLLLIARALDTTLDALVEQTGDDEVVIRPLPSHARGLTTWVLSSADGIHGKTVAKMRITPERPEERGVHAGRDWFTVLSGIVRLELGERADPGAPRRGRGVLHDDPACHLRPSRAGGNSHHLQPRRRPGSPSRALSGHGFCCTWTTSRWRPLVLETL
ncbi:helix-turn-helix domain-containing protein [Arthrobacter psychrolactophilus]